MRLFNLVTCCSLRGISHESLAETTPPTRDDTSHTTFFGPDPLLHSSFICCIVLGRVGKKDLVDLLFP